LLSPKQNHNLLTAKTSFENVEEFKYLGKTVTKIAVMKKLRAY
jgi:hypothetical protein